MKRFSPTSFQKSKFAYQLLTLNAASTSPEVKRTNWHVFLSGNLQHGIVSLRPTSSSCTNVERGPLIDAWQNLEKDGTAEDVIEVNEGLGQTHRQRLQEDDRVRDYTGEPPHRGGYFSSGRGGRSGQTYVLRI